MKEEEKILFEPYERKIRNQQNEIRKLNKELEYMRKVLHRKNLDGMRQCRRRKEQKEEIEGLDKRLEQAKEIIREFMTFDSSYKNDDEFQEVAKQYDFLIAKAEQFIKEIKENDRQRESTDN